MPPKLKVVEDKVKPLPAEYVVFVSVEVIVIASVVALVVIDTFVPATNVKVSEFESVTTSLCPETEIVLNIF